MSDVSTEKTLAVLENHLRAAHAGNVDGILSDFTEASVLYLPQGALRGLGQIRKFYEEFIAGAKTTGLMEAFEMLRQDVEGEIAYIVWRAEPVVHMATDTLIVRDGKIAVQTFASCACGA